MSRALVLAVLLFSFSGLTEEPEHAAQAEHHEIAAHHGGGHEEEKAEPFLEYSVDLALGFADFETWSGAAEELPTFEQSHAWTTSLLLGAEHATPHVTFGARIPVVVGGLTSMEGERHTRTVGPLLGNLELEATHVTALAEGLHFETTFELALPTAFGEEAPLPGEQLEGSVDADAVARGEVLRAAEFARGSLDSTLFEPGRAGLIPKLSLDYRRGAFHVRPTIKFEMLFDTRGRAKEHLIGEFVGGVRMSYVFADLIEPYVHAWTNITVTDHIERNVDVILFEPGLRLRLGRIKPALGVVLPLFGRLLEDRTLAIRFGVAGEL